jgi:hypothetical protein
MAMTGHPTTRNKDSMVVAPAESGRCRSDTTRSTSVRASKASASDSVPVLWIVDPADAMRRR